MKPLMRGIVSTCFCFTCLEGGAAAQQTRPRIYQQVEGVGGPRVIIEHEAGRIIEYMAPKDAAIKPGYVIVWSERAIEAGAATTGLRITIYGLLAVNDPPKAADIVNLYLDASDAAQCVNVLKAAITYLDTPHTDSQKKQEYFRWQSPDGLVIIAGASSGVPDVFIATDKRDGPSISVHRDGWAKMIEAFEAGIRLSGK